MVLYAFINIPKEKIKEWFRETWWFVRLIFPLLLIGVSVVRIIRKILPEIWIKSWLGEKSLSTSFLANSYRCY